MVAKTLSIAHRLLLDDINTKAKFARKFDKTDGCWNWKGRLHNGYGKFYFGRALQIMAHRAALHYSGFFVPCDMSVDHLCRNRACVNPSHLEICTLKENILRGVGVAAKNSLKKFCAKGHPLSGNNLYIRTRKEKGRACKACIYQRIYQKRDSRTNLEKTP